MAFIQQTMSQFTYCFDSRFGEKTPFSASTENDSFSNDLVRAQMLLEYLNIKEEPKKTIDETESCFDPNTLYFDDFDGAYIKEETAAEYHHPHQYHEQNDNFGQDYSSDYYSDGKSSTDDESLHTIDDNDSLTHPFHRTTNSEYTYENKYNNDNCNSYVSIDEWKKNSLYDTEEELTSNFEMTSHKRYRISMIMHYERQLRQMEQEMEDRLIEQEVSEWMDSVEGSTTTDFEQY
ncbi:10160_t:CDS:1 [Ambispora gerdemannii]|uniref:10160_t:CDS:1 n=1 Tax=Ambispora gerdemannii TaxID=144530 RepID=A0A9N8ZQT1_9GLOM|nr:10160_t:CDS:1 [Ambispora gerdemannii]